MSSTNFIGRGEVQTKKILQILFPKGIIKTQVPIKLLISNQEYEFLDQEIKNHKFDMVVYNGTHTLVVEVNYKHREKAARKWRQIFTKLIIDNGLLPVTINDYNCDYLFSDSIILKKKHPWGAHLDIIRELQAQGITPNGSLL